VPRRAAAPDCTDFAGLDFLRAVWDLAVMSLGRGERKATGSLRGGSGTQSGARSAAGSALRNPAGRSGTLTFYYTVQGVA
jgi:hypothetical protein